ncbi:very short patch repair endonuclease [Ruegeria atlantica]|uniref:very short patch repair endonuclease n=1 Tax=Ruegeria atlantica TaxID=81569 RepID=UPI00147A4D89|nr:DNA mismatch endonuclease Vsr [Ruegeria atlantica]
MVDVHSRKQRAFNMSRIRGQDTKPETALRSRLHKEGFRFRKNVKGLPGTPDIVLPKYKTVIFVHGCFWHRHRDCRFATTPKTNTEFWELKFRDTIARDKKQVQLLESLGWKTITIWECSINDDLDRTIDRIKIQLKCDH